MSELDFLLELLLNHTLKKATKDVIQARIRDVQTQVVVQPVQRQRPAPLPAQEYVRQAQVGGIPDMPEREVPAPPSLSEAETKVFAAQSPEAREFLKKKNAMIAEQASHSLKGSGSPKAHGPIPNKREGSRGG